MISKKKKIPKFWGFYFEAGRGKETEAKKEFGEKDSREPRVISSLATHHRSSCSYIYRMAINVEISKIKNFFEFVGESLGKENLSWVFERLSVEKYWWISRVSLTIDLGTSNSRIFCMIRKKAKNIFFLWWRLACPHEKFNLNKGVFPENQAWSNQMQPAINLSTFISLG